MQIWRRSTNKLARAHWVKWRFIGLNEPLRYQRFSSGGAAQHFIRTDGPSKTGKLGFAILTKETRAVPPRVVMSTPYARIVRRGDHELEPHDPLSPRDSG